MEPRARSFKSPICESEELDRLEEELKELYAQLGAKIPPDASLWTYAAFEDWNATSNSEVAFIWRQKFGETLPGWIENSS